MRGTTVLVHGVFGAVGSFACQLALADGARVVATTRRAGDLAPASATGAVTIVALDDVHAVDLIRAAAPEGVQRIIEVSLSDHADLDSEVASPGAVVAAYGSAAERPALPFWPMLFANMTVRLLGSDDFPASAKSAAAIALTRAAASGQLQPAVRAVLPLSEIAAAHATVETRGKSGRVLLAIPS